MQEPGQRLRNVREHLGLRYRDVEEASQKIARQHGKHEFVVGLSRLADIENHGTLPTVYRMYSLCVIYGLDFGTVLSWYGVNLSDMPGDAAHISPQRTILVQFETLAEAEVEFPVSPEPAIDVRRTSYLSRQLRKWGKLPVLLLNSIDARQRRYALVGTDDWSMYPIIAPGSFIQIDETKRRISNSNWQFDYERPIYFLEYRDGYRCAWCTARDGMLIVQGPSGSLVEPEVLKYPGDVDLIGQVVAVATRFDQGKRRRIRS